MTTRPISAAEARTLRLPILRPGLPPESAVFDGDDDPDPRHFGAFDPAGRLIGVASIYRATAPRPLGDPAGHWQLRGMATLEEARGSGGGRALLTACRNEAEAAGGNW